MDSEPPADQVPLSHHNFGNLDRQSAETKLRCMEDIGTLFSANAGQVVRRVFKIRFALLHPLQSKSCGAIFEPMKETHPADLFWEGNFTETDERHARSLAHKSAHELARVRPDSVGSGCGTTRSQYAR